MCGEHERFWWPLDLSEREQRAVDEMSALLDSYPALHDRALSTQAASLLADSMRRGITEIDDRDTLPNLCHVINGWGNAPLADGSVLDGYARYVHVTDDGSPGFLQCGDEGDFHPWQSFAYAVMAGVTPDTPIAGANCNLFELALGSRALNTKDGCELGHLLYAAAHWGLPGDTPFWLIDEVVPLARLVEMAIDAHHDGHFRVCRKVHLTEGLCAIAALDPAFAGQREVAQGFLDGQMDLLPVLCAAVRGARLARERAEPVLPGSVLHALRESLVIEGFLENHYYLAGHLIELLTLAHGFGYEVSPRHWAAARFVVDELNRWLPEYLPQVFFPACFLHFGHYRRATSLLDEVADGHSLDAASRARFTADLRGGVRREQPVLLPSGDGIFNFGRSDPPMRQELTRAVAAYRAIAPAVLAPRGNGAHFRRVLVPGWPRWLHFELFDYGSPVGSSSTSGLGVELHLESAEQPALFAALGRLAVQMKASSLLSSCELDEGGWGGSGRLRRLFPDGSDPETIALALRELIETAKPALTAELGARYAGSLANAR
jgi:hypothetical protein